MHTSCKQELRRPRRVEAAAGKASRLGRRKAAANPVPIALDAAPVPAVKNSTQEFIGGFPSSDLKADDRIRTGDVQLGKLTFYH